MDGQTNIRNYRVASVLKKNYYLVVDGNSKNCVVVVENAGMGVVGLPPGGVKEPKSNRI